MTKKNHTPFPKDLPDAELEVLATLWQLSEAAAREVRESMDEYRPMTHGAMVTLLKRLEAKGLVEKRKGNVGKAFLYRPTREPEPMYRKIMRDMRQRIFGGSGVAMVASLFEVSAPTDEDLIELEALFKDLRRKQAERNKKGDQS